MFSLTADWNQRSRSRNGVFMKTANAANGLLMHAAEALKAVLGEVSSIRLLEMKCEPQSRGRVSEILARIEVLGHIHLLACEVRAHGNTQQLKTALGNTRAGSADRGADSIRLIIAPHLTPEAQALCKQRRAGFLDLVGNARIDIGEVFISKRTILPRMQELALTEAARVSIAALPLPVADVYFPGAIPRSSIGSDQVAAATAAMA
jgi:hypothetical protein